MMRMFVAISSSLFHKRLVLAYICFMFHTPTPPQPNTLRLPGLNPLAYTCFPLVQWKEFLEKNNNNSKPNKAGGREKCNLYVFVPIEYTNYRQPDCGSNDVKRCLNPLWVVGQQGKALEPNNSGPASIFAHRPISAQPRSLKAPQTNICTLLQPHSPTAPRRNIWNMVQASGRPASFASNVMSCGKRLDMHHNLQQEIDLSTRNVAL